MQDTIVDILLIFRVPVIAITDDYCRIKTSEPLQSYRINTVRYGQSCAQSLAIRCVRKLAENLQYIFPLAAHALLYDLYVDVGLPGVYNESEAMHLLHHLNALLSMAAFLLHELRSNARTIRIVTNTCGSDGSTSF